MNMTKLLTSLSIVLLVVCALAVPTKADTVGTLTLSGCGSQSGCPDATYSFDITSTSASLKITINSATNSTNDLITGVDLGFTPSKNISNLQGSGPAGFNYTDTGSLNNSGCGGNGGAFICSSGSGAPIVTGQTYTWNWTFVNSGNTAPMGDVHIGANYGPNNGLIVSCTINGCSGVTSPSPVPEPASMVLLGTGLLALGGFTRRFKKS
jgi:hypothetical protein